MKRLTIVIALCAASAGVRADTLADQLRLLDGDAPFLLTVKPKAIFAVITWLRSIGGQVGGFVSMGLAEVQKNTQQQLGFDPTTPTGYAASGLDVDAPISASFMAIDPSYERAYQALAKARDAKAQARIARAFWRHRVLLRVKDETKVKAGLKAVAANGPDTAATADGDLGKLLAIDARQADKLKKLLAPKKVLLVQLGPNKEELAFFHLDGPWLVLDVFGVLGPGAIDWKRDEKELLKQLGRKPARGGAGTVTSRGAGAQLAAADAALWMDPSRVIDITKAAGRDKMLRAVAMTPDAAKMLAVGEKEVARCEDFRPMATQGTFEDFAWTFKADGKAFELAGVWGLRAGSTLPSALAAADDGLVDLATAKDALAVGSLYTQGLKPLRTVPRPGGFAKGRASIEESARLCGFGGALFLTVLGWPQYASVVIDSLPKEVVAVLDQARNLAFAFKSFGMKPEDNLGVVLSSFEGAVGPLLDAALIAGIGQKDVHKLGSRKIDIWRPRTPNDPMGFRVPLPGGRVAAGVAIGGPKALDWAYGRPSPRAAPGQTPLLAVARVDVPRAIQLFAKADPYAGAMATDVGKRLGNLTGALRLSGQTLVGILRLETR